MADRPFLREVTLRLPRVLWPLPKRYGHILAFTEDGKIVEDLQDPSGNYPETTGQPKLSTECTCRTCISIRSAGWPDSWSSVTGTCRPIPAVMHCGPVRFKTNALPWTETF